MLRLSAVQNIRRRCPPLLLAELVRTNACTMRALRFHQLWLDGKLMPYRETSSSHFLICTAGDVCLMVRQRKTDEA